MIRKFSPEPPTLSLAAALGLLACAAAAADNIDAEECAKISAAQERLACFDRVHGVGKAAEAATPAAVAAPSDPGTAAAAVAGTGAATAAQPAPPSQTDFGLEKPKAELEGDSLTSGIAATGKDAYDRLIFELDNGQIWRQVEYKRFPVKAGQTAVIRHGAFGSYKLYIQGKKRWTRVRRVE